MSLDELLTAIMNCLQNPFFPYFNGEKEFYSSYLMVVKELYV